MGHWQLRFSSEIDPVDTRLVCPPGLVSHRLGHPPHQRHMTAEVLKQMNRNSDFGSFTLGHVRQSPSPLGRRDLSYNPHRTSHLDLPGGISA